MSWSHRHALVIPTAVALIAAGALVVHAQLTSDNVIHGCVGQGGNLRVVKANDSCRGGETRISWGSGLVGYEIVTSDFIWGGQVQGISGTRTADCPAGKKVLGGGIIGLLDIGGGPVQGTTSGLIFEHGSYPLDEDTWAATFQWNGIGDVVGVRTFATCAQ